jgi:hypothetical protein
MVSNSPSLADIRQVVLYFIATSTQSHLVHKDEVSKFVKAAKELYVSPGINPHNGARCSECWKITVASLGPTGPFWWSTPGLQENHDPNGATVYNEHHVEIVYISHTEST